MAPSIVISNMTMMLGHHVTNGMLPVGSGQASSVMRVSHVAASRPMSPPPAAIQYIHVAWSR
jgi:hypothetical protein